jgi:chromosome partitioning protein
MKIVSIWNPKGGQGKSLFAVNLAAAACQVDLKPVVICRDPQGTAMLFHRNGHLPFEVLPDIPAARPDCDLIFIDHMASDWNLPPAPIVVMPTKAVRSDVATFADALARVRETGKYIIPVVTDANMNRKSEKRVVQSLKKLGAFELPSSVVFTDAAEDYRTIFDAALDKSYNADKRRQDMRAILSAVLNAQSQSLFGKGTTEFKEAVNG